MKQKLQYLLLIGVALTCTPLASRAQFRDLSTRPNTDTTAISEFIKSYQRQLEPLYVHAYDGERFGPLATFTNRKFVSTTNQTLPLESAESLVTIGNSSLLGAAIGSGLTFILGVVGFFTFYDKPNIDVNSKAVILSLSPLPGALVGGLIGLLVPREENAAPMNAFRKR